MLWMLPARLQFKVRKKPSLPAWLLSHALLRQEGEEI